MSARLHRSRIFSRGFRTFLVASLVASIFFIGCGNSGSSGNSGAGSGSGSGVTASVRGTASMGSPIAGATVTLKDSTGKSTTATTASDGTYTLNTSGMTPPYFVQVVTTSGTTFYSVSADALASTTINTSVLTDVIVRSWFTAQGVNPNSAFANPVTNPPPSPLAVQVISTTVIDVVQLWLNNAGVTVTTGTPSGSQVNIISSTYVANGTGLDAVLGLATDTVDSSTGAVTQISISNGTTTQVSSPTYSAGSLTVNTTTTSGGATSSEAVTGSVPNTAQQNALNAIDARITSLENIINSKGTALSASDFLPFFASDYLNDGNNNAADAANYAQSVTGATVAFQVLLVKSLDTTNGLADITFTLNVSSQSQTIEWFFKNEGGSWLLYGDQRIAQLDVQQLTWNNEGFSNLGDIAVINAGFTAPVGTVQTGVIGNTNCSGSLQTVSPNTVTGGGSIWPSTPCGSPSNPPPFVTTGNLNYGGTNSGGQGQQTMDEFAIDSKPLSTLLAAGTPFTFNLMPVSGSPVTYTSPVNSGTNESITITSVSQGSSTIPSSGIGTLANYSLGQPVTFNWTLPQTFAIASVKYSVTVFDFVPGSGSGNSCGGNGNSVAINTTSATLTLSSTDTCTGNPIKSIDLDVTVMGVNGEMARATVFIQ
jgi:hypothetical protein